jgi:starch phosphorylase
MPREWINRVRQSMARLTPQFSSNRMLREYTERYYATLARAVAGRGISVAEQIEQWHTELARHWPKLRFGNAAAARGGPFPTTHPASSRCART